jgi:hypothetical protein
LKEDIEREETQESCSVKRRAVMLRNNHRLMSIYYYFSTYSITYKLIIKVG